MNTNYKAAYEAALKLEKKYSNFETMKKNAKSIEVVEILTKRNKRAKNKPSTLTVRSTIHKRLQVRLHQIAKALPDEEYSMGSDIRVELKTVKNVSIYATDSRTYSYAKRCKFRPTLGFVKLVLTPRELMNTYVIGGMVTYIAPKQRNKVKKCYWYEGEGKKQNFKLVKVEGYIFYGYHAKTKEEAKAGGLKNIETEMKLEASKKAYNKALRRQYSFADSLAAGNCEAGTRAFIIRLGLNAERKYRGQYLLNIATEKSTSSVKFIEKMIKYFAK